MQPMFSEAYVTARDPLPEDVFLAQLSEFTCVQYRRCNDLTGKVTLWELVAQREPEKKAQLLTFLESNPLKQLLEADRIGSGFDLDRWELRFLFEDKRLNRAITGYGRTEAAAPYLQQLVAFLPRILSQEEQAYRAMQKYRYMKK